MSHISVAQPNVWDFACIISELGGVFKWPMKMLEIVGALLVNWGGGVINFSTKKGGISGAILVNWVRYLRGPPKWGQFWFNIGELCGVFKWPTNT